MEQITTAIPAKKSIALVAHDGKKSALTLWCQKHQDVLSQHNLYGTGTTGHLIEKTTGLAVEKLLSGPMGGDQQLGAKIAEHEVNLLIFFWDPLASQPHDPDVKALLRLAAVWNIPVACNEATADMLIASELMSQQIHRTIPDYHNYLADRLD
ncbi:MAG: methylglyoxal synthase [Pseudoalteromonas spongiae]|uniref:Methylglyoxal synthase n=1 Tax=Pseudoalteromonas spongiae TaxID=298657 RepID=A0ABU8EPX0_9GAMM|nr:MULTISPECIES: methylglyoxal synthase [Pseudoalteromonas]KPV97621.1 Methylglyoxal synthase [Pseudoalteromonas sp. P1-9]MCF6457893.1 methylglyoxal synthase [Pseudoalteromonas sp. MMG024]MEC8327803.1 methylglyoxal synthase [Pseudomonadota bacterium]TMO83837.1 methylglyoxal synthase [Pseudoalteromonas spongiae]